MLCRLAFLTRMKNYCSWFTLTSFLKVCDFIFLFFFPGSAKNNFLLTNATECLYRLSRVFLQELKRNMMFSIVGLHESAQVLKREASLPDPKPEVTPMSTPINRNTWLNHADTVTQIARTPRTPNMSRFHCSDPGTPTEKVSEVLRKITRRIELCGELTP